MRWVRERGGLDHEMNLIMRWAREMDQKERHGLIKKSAGWREGERSQFIMSCLKANRYNQASQNRLSAY